MNDAPASSQILVYAVFNEFVKGLAHPGRLCAVFIQVICRKTGEPKTESFDGFCSDVVVTQLRVAIKRLYDGGSHQADLRKIIEMPGLQRSVLAIIREAEEFATRIGNACFGGVGQ